MKANPTISTGQVWGVAVVSGDTAIAVIVVAPTSQSAIQIAEGVGRREFGNNFRTSTTLTRFHPSAPIVVMPDGTATPVVGEL